jgi:hypothetical protein
VIKHFMILSSSYSSGTIIALHYIIDKQMNPEMLTLVVWSEDGNVRCNNSLLEIHKTLNGKNGMNIMGQ